MSLEFRILGPLEVVQAGRPLPLGGRKQRAMLAVLLMHANEVVSSDRLIDDVWGERSPRTAASAVQVYVSRLRKLLGDEMLLTRRPGYLFRVAPKEFDLMRFEQLLEEARASEPATAREKLGEALALWRGPPLADLAHEEFAQAEIRRLEELRGVALEEQVEADLALGRHAALVPQLEVLVVQYPLRERLRAQLMLALYRCGRQAEALAAYQATRRVLVDELGIEPSKTLQELEQAILSQDNGLDLAPAPSRERSVLVVALDDSALSSLLRLAAPLAQRPTREIVIARLLEDHSELQPATGALLEQRRLLLADGIAARGAAFTSTAPGDDAVRIANELDADLLLIEAPPTLIGNPMLEAILAAAPCDVGVLLRGEQLTATGQPVLVPFVGADHDWSAVELGAWLAGALDTSLVLAGPREGASERDASRLLASVSLAVQRAVGVAAEPLLLDAGPDALLRAAHTAGCVVVGLTERWQKDGLGQTRQAVATRARAPVVLVRRGPRPGGLAPREALTRFTWSLRV